MFYTNNNRVYNRFRSCYQFGNLSGIDFERTVKIWEKQVLLEVEKIQAWLFQIEPLPGVSLSHFIGQFRRSNNLTLAALGKEAGFGGAVISRWEKFRFNPSPSPSQLASLAVVMGVEVERLMEMLPPEGMGMKMKPIRSNLSPQL